ncbi:hypothetical protein LOAG_07028 [Loa loa]|uniref:Uncharacterized protein n=1 Tax=Loa loa TaxID=7209 RepID=A0A1S0TWN9_LOALO|nr:hypothetical protein LOAG_07028 [Loa loa]EFO21459.1 hypothetical protein LOAG_07028 [Loa loa]
MDVTGVAIVITRIYNHIGKIVCGNFDNRMIPEWNRYEKCNRNNKKNCLVLHSLSKEKKNDVLPQELQAMRYMKEFAMLYLIHSTDDYKKAKRKDKRSEKR